MSSAALPPSLPLDGLTATAAWSSGRRLRTAYTGPLIRVRRSTDNAELNIGYTASNDLDTTALLNFVNGVTLPLDSVSVSAAGAYSLRRLRGAYTGPALRVRRSSDNAEQDIGFDNDGNLNTASLLAFVGSGDGFVTVWYDQSGNARDKTQTAAASQPRIVVSGTVQTMGSRPAINFGGSPQHLATATSYNVWAVVAAAQHTSFVSLAGLWGVTSDLGIRLDSSSFAYRNSIADFGTAFARLNGVQTAPATTTALVNTAPHIIAMHRSTVAGVSPRIGGYFTPRNINGRVAELIEFAAEPTAADYIFIEQSEAAYYGITHATAMPEGFVSVLYDQSGAGLNATQTTAANQGRVVVEGALNTIGTRPAILGNGTSSGYAIANAAVQAMNAVVRPAVNSGGAYRMITTSAPMGGAMILASLNAGTSWGTYGGANRPANTQLLANTTYVLTLNGGGFFANGAPDGTYASTEGQAAGRIMSSTSSMYFSGSIGEVTWFASALGTTDRQALETNQNAYWV